MCNRPGRAPRSWAARVQASTKHLAALLSTSAEDLRADLEEWYQEMDWPWDSRSVPPEIVEALRVDPRT